MPDTKHWERKNVKSDLIINGKLHMVKLEAAYKFLSFNIEMELHKFRSLLHNLKIKIIC